MDGRHTEQSPAPEQLRSPEPVRRRKKRKSVPQLILQDILLTGMILVTFAFFHHVLPRLTASSQPSVTPMPLSTRTPETASVPGGSETEDPTPGGEPAGTDAPADTPAPTPEPTPEPIAWKTKFADHFTDEVVVTDHSYTSPNIAINIEKIVTDDLAPSTVYVADVYVASIENFQTYFATGKFLLWGAESSQALAKASGAILSINGDYADSQSTGFLVRNGELYMNEQTLNDICVLFRDGTMETYGPSDYLVDDILARDPWQVWKFGPALLDAEGQPLSTFNTTGPISDVNPRSGVGYYEPGHYCFVIVDGRQNGYSAGMRIERFARLFADLGCSCAYNLDGGQSAIMTFQERIYSHPYLGGRDSGDILLIREVEEG